MRAMNPSEKKKQVSQFTVRTEKTRLVRYLGYLWVQIKGEDFNSNKLLNLAGCTVKYDPLN